MISLTEYAVKKHLDIENLRRWYVTQQDDAVVFPYRDYYGTIVARQVRTSWDKFHWAKGDAEDKEIVPYGIWHRWPEEVGDIYLVEGASDAQTLWQHQIPALGIPGATMWRAEWRKYLGPHRRVAVQEPGNGGAIFVQRLADSLGGVHVISMAPYKDVSDAYVALGDGFRDFWESRVCEARYLHRTPVSKKAPQNYGNDATYGPELLALARECTELTARPHDEFWGRCPFHEEKTASFHLNAKTGIWYCFGCGAGGGVRDFKERMGVAK